MKALPTEVPVERKNRPEARFFFQGAGHIGGLLSNSSVSLDDL